MKVYIAISPKNNLVLGCFDINNTPDKIADKLISSGLINDLLVEIEYPIDGRYCTNDFDIYESIEFTADNGKFTIELKEYEIK